METRPVCKYCGADTIKNGKYRQTQLWLCTKCKRSFVDNGRIIDPSAHMGAWYRKGKTFEEIYGTERAAELRQKSGGVPWNKGLTVGTNESVAQAIAKMTVAKRTPKNRARSAEIMQNNSRKFWDGLSSESREGYLTRKAQKIKEAHARNGFAEKHRECMKAKFADPEFRKWHMERTKEGLEQGRGPSWSDPERKARRVTAWLKSCFTSPSYIEKRFMEIAEKYKLPYKFVGDGKLILDGRCPDFLNIDGAKKVIELFGDRWHESSEVAGRTSQYAKFGYDTLVIWESQMNKMSDEEIVETVREFEAKPHVDSVV